MCRLMLLGEVLVPLQSILVFHLAHPRVEVCPRPQQPPEVRVVEHSMLLCVVVKIVSKVSNRHQCVDTFFAASPELLQSPSAESGPAQARPPLEVISEDSANVRAVVLDVIAAPRER